MLSESHPLVRRAIRFLLLPYCFVRFVNWSECTRSKWRVAIDLLYIFFVLKDYPDNYGACRLWEHDRSEWPRFYGSNYNPYQRYRLRREVHPLDLERAFQDKEVSDELCRGLGIRVPETVGVLQPGKDNIAQKLSRLFEGTPSDRLIIKPVRGHGGIGVALAVRQAGELRVAHDGRLDSPLDFQPLTRCIVQEVLLQTPALAQVAPSSLNTLRLLTMLTKSSEVIVLGACMRFGVGDAFVDNSSAGGIAVGVDHERGRLMRFAFNKAGRRFTHHPVSKIEFAGFEVPSWDEALAFGKRVQRSFPFFKLLGMDLGFTTDGVVLVEINSDADLAFQEQTSGPLLTSRQTWEAFSEYELFYNRKQEELFRREDTRSEA